MSYWSRNLTWEWFELIEDEADLEAIKEIERKNEIAMQEDER